MGACQRSGLSVASYWHEKSMPTIVCCCDGLCACCLSVDFHVDHRGCDNVAAGPCHHIVARRSGRRGGATRQRVLGCAEPSTFRRSSSTSGGHIQCGSQLRWRVNRSETRR
jgi:hypothetical protein